MTRVIVKPLEWATQRNVQDARVRTGYTSLRVTKATRELLEEVSKGIGRYQRGADEVLWLVLCRVLDRDPALAPAMATAAVHTIRDR